MPSVYQELAAEILRAQKLASTRGAPQIIFSTIEGGAVPIRAEDGQLTGSVGEQYDGTFGAVTLAGPTPPQPSQPTVEQVPGGVRVRVDGTWTDAAVAPLDFSYFEVYALENPDVTDWMSFDGLRGQIGSARGGELTIGLTRNTDFYVWVAARSAAGKLGPRSIPVGPVRAGQMIQSELDIDWEKWSGTTVFYGPATPTTDKYGDLWLKELTPGEYESYRWTPGTPDAWIKVQDQGITEALIDTARAASIADSTAQILSQATKPTWSGAAGTAIWVDTAHGNAQYTWNGTTFVPRSLGNGAVQPRSLVASDVIATGTVTAALLEAIMVLVNTLVAGDPTGTHVEISQNGVIAYADDPVDGVPNEIGRFGGTVGIRNPTTGVLVANINENGDIQANRINTVDPNPTFGGTTLKDLLWNTSWGVVGAGEVAPSSSEPYWCTPKTDGELGLAEFAFVAQPGRTYELVSEPFELWADTGDSAYLRIRWTDNGDTPWASDATVKLREYVVSPIRAGFSGSRQFSAIFYGPTLGVQQATQYRLLMTYGVCNGSTGIRAGVKDKIFRFSIRDVGPQRPNVAVYSTGGGTISGGAPPPPPPPAGKITYVDTFFGNWSGSWIQSGARRNDVGSSMYQGKGDTFNGIQAGAWAWHDLTGVLAGSVVNKVELFLFCEHAWYGTGGRAQIGVHSTLNDPGGTWPGQRADFFFRDFARGQGQWIDVSWWGSDIQSGAVRGITLYANTTDPLFYMRFTGVGPVNAPAIRVTYTR